MIRVRAPFTPSATITVMDTMMAERATTGLELRDTEVVLLPSASRLSSSGDGVPVLTPWCDPTMHVVFSRRRRQRDRH